MCFRNTGREELAHFILVVLTSNQFVVIFVECRFKSACSAPIPQGQPPEKCTKWHST